MSTLQLDLGLARRNRDAGIAKVASKNATFLETMRGVARMMCRQKGKVTADDLREWAECNGVEPTHPNAWGAVFNKEFAPGEFVVSRQAQGHSNRIRVWRLKSCTDHGE